ncbi:hypothetical protein Q3G72_002612 [Acer saccharum]|nr:hypothetical protein Q3G72_002612 [Acer saccharum]
MKGKDKNWKKEWIMVEGEWGQDYFIAGEEKHLPTHSVGESTWKKRGEVSLPKESTKILQKIKDKDYDPLGRRGDPFDQHRVDQVLKIPVPTTPVVNPSSPPKIAALKKEEGVKREFIPVGIHKLPTPSARPDSSSVSKLEARLGRSQVPDKGKGVMKAHKPPASMVKEPPALSDAEVIEAFRRRCPCGGPTSLSLVPASDVMARGSASVAEKELRLLEKRKGDVEVQLKQLERAMVHLTAGKRKVDKTMAGVADQAALLEA